MANNHAKHVLKKKNHCLTEKEKKEKSRVPTKENTKDIKQNKQL